MSSRSISSAEDALLRDIRGFAEYSKETQEQSFQLESGHSVPVLVNEYWTSKQREAHSLHEISYRACFKAQLPRFFINRLTRVNDRVFDPFMGRGTTLLEAALMGRRIGGSDVNPLSQLLLRSRLTPPCLSEVEEWLDRVEYDYSIDEKDPLLVFYHPKTLGEINTLRRIFIEKDMLTPVEQWIRMVVTNRLTGHSKGFLSVYTLPPNQAVSIDSQKRINQKRNQVPDYRDLKKSVLKKSRSLLKKMDDADLGKLGNAAKSAELILGSADNLKDVASGSYQLVVTSPPFLDVIDYKQDNWLRCWFNGLDAQKVPIWQMRHLQDWENAMFRTLTELKRVLQVGGWIAFEVGEVRKGTIQLEQCIANLADKAGLKVSAILVNVQDFTKTAACWGVDNLQKGTNSNRIVLLQKR